MKLPKWEVERIEARIAKCKRRIAAGYCLPDKRGETEQARLDRLTKVLNEGLS